MKATDLLSLGKFLWPDVTFYRQQREIIQSVEANDETVVPAGNMLGKDFCAGFIAVAFFLTRQPCRIVTTSVKDDHLRVLWGEIYRFIQTSRLPLDEKHGGPLIINHRELRRVVGGEPDPLSYVCGMVAADGAAMQGHHVARQGDGVPRTLFLCDESSGVPQTYYDMADTWAERKLIIGNPWPCENFFKHAVKGKPDTDDRGGDIRAPDNGRYYRKVIRIRAEDSPNVRFGLAQKRAGQVPTDEILIPGVKPYGEYVKNRLLWDNVRQCVGLDADWHEGGEVLLFPPEWLNLAEQRAVELKGLHRKAETMGVDPAEGGDKSAWTVIDKLGIIELISMKTPDTADIPNQTLALMRKHSLQPRQVLFDAGGGGKQHADHLRRLGYNVRTVGFGESATKEKQRGATPLRARIEGAETQYAYKNRRAEMYGLLSLHLDPSLNPDGFGLPAEYTEIRRQLGPIPRRYDGEGRLWLPPKSRRTPNSKEETLIDLLGHSPDEVDSLVLAIYGILKQRTQRPKAGALQL